MLLGLKVGLYVLLGVGLVVLTGLIEGPCVGKAIALTQVPSFGRGCLQLGDAKLTSQIAPGSQHWVEIEHIPPSEPRFLTQPAVL